MTSLLEDIIKDKIRDNGPMTIGQFMELALGHPEHGYYMKQDPFGRSGDFVTAPEVSQLFGEMIGAWVADVWLQMGQPEKLIVLECGPGRGTLMADILRATKNVQGFHDAINVHLLEMSPTLKVKQAEVLSEYEPCWHEKLEDVPGGAPMVVIGNEFLDALPFQQFVRTKDGDEPRMIALNEKGDLTFVPEKGEVSESSAERERFAQDVSERLKVQGGAALFIDYGHMKSGLGDTFQAIKGHEYVDVLSNIGDADLTSHVDFQALTPCAGVEVCGPVMQGVFLKALGIEMRAAMLKSKSTSLQAEMVEKGLHRLVDSDQMGSLFKVIGFYNSYDTDLKPAGFF